MKYLVDTSVLLQSLIAKPKLSQRALNLLADDSSELYFSAASSWEITIKTAIGKLILPEPPSEFVIRAIGLMALRNLDITHSHAFALAALPNHHRDPFDRMLVAQAQTEQLVLLTTDRVFERYKVDHVFCGR